jgi:hypothetical protein
MDLATASDWILTAFPSPSPRKRWNAIEFMDIVVLSLEDGKGYLPCSLMKAQKWGLWPCMSCKSQSERLLSTTTPRLS